VREVGRGSGMEEHSLENRNRWSVARGRMEM